MTDQATPAQKLAKFSRDGFGTDKAGLRRNRNRLLSGVGLALVALALMAPDLMDGTHAGLPKNDAMTEVSAPLVNATRDNHEILLTLKDQKAPFAYPSKAQGEQAVWGALCRDCVTTVWTDPADTRAKPIAFQVAVQGHIVRSYADVKAAWIANNRIAFWIAGFLAIAALFLGALAMRMQQRIRALAH